MQDAHPSRSPVSARDHPSFIKDISTSTRRPSTRPRRLTPTYVPCPVRRSPSRRSRMMLTHVTPVLKLSAQLFISIQPGTGDEDEHVINRVVLRPPLTLVVTGHLGCGGAGGLGGGRRGGRVGFGRGGAGAVFRRNQPSRFWRALRPLIESPHPRSPAPSAVVRPRAFAVQGSSYLQ